MNDNSIIKKQNEILQLNKYYIGKDFHFSIFNIEEINKLKKYKKIIKEKTI
jgi:hypothetical protein